MQRISSWTELVTALGLFRYGSVTAGVPPTPVKAEWLNMVQEELAHVVLAYLPALDKDDNTQLLQAIQQFGLAYAVKANTLAGYGILDAYTKAQTDTMVSAKANWGITLAAYGIGDAYTKTATDTLLAGKANNATTLGGYGISDAYIKTEIDWLLSQKANNAITLGGYGIGDAYTKTATDALLAGKANNATTLGGYGINDAYTMATIDAALAGLWNDGNATPKAILAQASAAVGGVGTYALMTNRSGGALSAGQVVAGGSLTYANTEDVVQNGGAASGTWRCMGYAAANPNDQGTTLFLRIS
jgi:phage-related tail fiber protein